MITDVKVHDPETLAESLSAAIREVARVKGWSFAKRAWITFKIEHNRVTRFRLHPNDDAFNDDTGELSHVEYISGSSFSAAAHTIEELTGLADDAIAEFHPSAMIVYRSDRPAAHLLPGPGMTAHETIALAEDFLARQQA